MMAVVMLLIAFAAQGLTFMIYGQREFCFNDAVAGDCTLEFGAYLSLAATAALYVAAIVWCCMPRSAPFCIAPGKNPSDLQTTAQKSQDYNEFFGANTVADMLEYKESNQPQYQRTTSQPFEPASVYDGGAAEQPSRNTSPWASSQLRGPIPQQQQQQQQSQQYDGLSIISEMDESITQPPPGFFPADDPSYGFQTPAPAGAALPIRRDTPDDLNSAAAWTPNPYGGDPFAVAAPIQSADFDNPFLLDNSIPPVDPASRPAYGNLQG